MEIYSSMICLVVRKEFCTKGERNYDEIFEN
jgi:hypothetical protein